MDYKKTWRPAKPHMWKSKHRFSNSCYCHSIPSFFLSFAFAPVPQWKTPPACCFVTRKSCSLTSGWKTWPKPSKFTAWTATPWRPPHPSPSSSWWPRRRWPTWASSTRPRRSCWTTLGAATTPWMKRRSAGCRPWRRTTCCCPSPTGSDTEGAVPDKRNSSRSQETKAFSAVLPWAVGSPRRAGGRRSSSRSCSIGMQSLRQISG